MSDFEVHSKESATEETRELLEKVEQTFYMIPTLA